MEERGEKLCFTDVVGQNKAANLVLRALTSDRVPHAYIFKGPDGVGKKLFARGLAAALNCRNQNDHLACGVCSSCKKFFSGNQPDFMVVSPEKGTIKINQVREMCKALSYPPYESRYRVVLMEDVHTMRQEAANSLLKTLEEPPAGNILILTADSSREVLTTISSRCQSIPFYGLETSLCAEIIGWHLPDLDEESRILLARLSEGSPGQALLLQEQEMLTILGRVLAVVSDSAIDGNRDVGMLLKVADEMAGLKEHLIPLLGLMRLWLRDLLVAETGGEKTGLNGFGMQSGQDVKNWSSKDLFAKLQAVDNAENALKRNCNRTLVCEVLLFQLHEETSKQMDS